MTEININIPNFLEEKSKPLFLKEGKKLKLQFKGVFYHVILSIGQSIEAIIVNHIWLTFQTKTRTKTHNFENRTGLQMTIADKTRKCDLTSKLSS